MTIQEYIVDKINRMEGLPSGTDPYAHDPERDTGTFVQMVQMCLGENPSEAEVDKFLEGIWKE